MIAQYPFCVWLTVELAVGSYFLGQSTEFRYWNVVIDDE